MTIQRKKMDSFRDSSSGFKYAYVYSLKYDNYRCATCSPPSPHVCITIFINLITSSTDSTPYLNQHKARDRYHRMNLLPNFHVPCCIFNNMYLAVKFRALNSATDSAATCIKNKLICYDQVRVSTCHTCHNN